MRVIYEPKGRAKEYADLAFNSYGFGCTNGCRYCFGPGVARKTREEFHRSTVMRPGSVFNAFAEDCQEMRRKGDTRRVHMNFISDPYPDVEAVNHITRSCIEIARQYGIGVNILTKGKYDTVAPDLALMKEAGVHLGVTCCFSNDDSRERWEPMASSIYERAKLLQDAHEMGIFTWVSMEPVIYPKEALSFFDCMCPDVDLWKVGKLNYHEHAKTVDWPKFRDDFIRLANYNGAKYIIKKDLLDAK